VSLAVAVGAEIADSERETELADVGRERPLTNLLRNPCGIAPPIDALHDEGGAEALDAGESGEALVVELLEGGEVCGDDAQEVVGLTEEPLGLPDVGDGGDGLSKSWTVSRSPLRMVAKTRASNVRPRALASRCAW